MGQKFVVKPDLAAIVVGLLLNRKPIDPEECGSDELDHDAGYEHESIGIAGNVTLPGDSVDGRSARSGEKDFGQRHEIVQNPRDQEQKPEPHGDQAIAEDALDRKSTRMNSSHK